jgi:Lon protease-like protein
MAVQGPCTLLTLPTLPTLLTLLTLPTLFTLPPLPPLPPVPTPLPLFPLPNVVLFPGVYLPLHIFEPRYREMVSDALEGDREIGMVLLKPGYEAEYEGRPPIFPIGCSGLIAHHERLPDGRFNVVLQGVERFRVSGEDDSRPYRIGLVERLVDPQPTDPIALRSVRQRLEALIAPMVERAAGEPAIPATMNDVDLIHALAQYMEFEPLEKQALLELDGVLSRAEALGDLIEMKTIATRGGGGGWH